MNEYDCINCISNKLYEKRDCMQVLLNPEATNEVWISVPTLDNSTSIARDEKGVTIQENRRVDEDGFFEVLSDFTRQMPDKSSFEVWLLFFEEVCLTAFADSVLFSLIEAETTATEYKGAIGSIDNEDVRIGLLGFCIEYAELIDAFNVIRRAKKDYERYHYEQMKKDDK